MTRFTASIISILMILLLVACESQNSEGDKEIVETSTESKNGEEKNSYSKDQIEELKRTSIQNFINENPDYKEENVESRWVVVLNSKISKDKKLSVTVKDQDRESNDILFLNNDIQDLSKLENGQNLIIVTTKLWKQSNPPQNDVLKITYL